MLFFARPLHNATVASVNKDDRDRRAERVSLPVIKSLYGDYYGGARRGGEAALYPTQMASFYHEAPRDSSSLSLLFIHSRDVSRRNSDVDSDESVASVVME